MTRKKVELVYITNDSKRKASYKKRKKGLMKKVSELSTLCGVDACVIMYNPYDPQPEVWPSPMGVQQVLSKFRQIPEMEQSKKMVNQESFLIQRNTKASEQLIKQCMINREKEMTHVMFQNLVGKDGIDGLNMMDLNDLGWLIDQNLKEVEKRIDSLTQTSHDPQGSSSFVAATPSVMPNAMSRTTVGDNVQTEANNIDSMQVQYWTTELMNDNPLSHVRFCGDEMVFPFVDNVNVNNNSFSE
ncbi:agamous-like MADS-box protein AGL80 [Hibiscus syriacus]|uniref:agamous-like MADS-box protein AGL80 n=1 Tax=Hibiscus syriacus TaxID=106335 RepID=UPI001923E9A8|nr:agamous-like MADS-box protein AGL80 [Hibiscus syriacus]